jgi:hypothetical protein
MIATARRAEPRRSARGCRNQRWAEEYARQQLADHGRLADAFGQLA